MADITLDDLNQILALNRYDSNILQYYDNVTYNIRFYMYNHRFQKSLSERRLFDEDVNQIFSEKEKIIIAETGVSSKYDITSLKISATHGSPYSHSPITFYNIEMVMHEMNSCDLVNKITAVSKCLGYASYVSQPYHIDIWFSGYEQATGKPVQIIEDMVLTYEVIINEVTTSVDNSGCEYKFSMTPEPQSNMDKYVTTMFQIGEIHPDAEGAKNKSSQYGGYVQRMVDLINEKYKKDNPAIAELYDTAEGGGYLVIDGYYTGKSTKYQQIVMDAIKKNDDEKELKKKRSENEFYNYAKNISMEDINTLDFSSCVINDFIGNESESANNGYIQFDAILSFEEVLQQLCFHCNELKDYIVTPIYKAKYLGNINGKQALQIYVSLVFTKNSYMEFFNKRIDKTVYTPLDKETDILQMELEEARDLVINGLLNKRYEWQYNGRETNLLSFTTNIDKLWIANLGLENVVTIKSSDLNVLKYLNELKEIQLLNELYEKTLQDPEKKLEDILVETNAPLEGARGLTSDKHLYLDDIYYCLDEKTIEKYLNRRYIYENNDSLSDASNLNECNEAQKMAIVANAGYGNIHSDNMIEVTLQILGDPYWLNLLSDNLLYKQKGNIDYGKLQHFAFSVRTSLDQTSDGEYDIKNVTEFSNIYSLVESVSVFESGKFTQSIKGVIDPAFIHLARIEGLSGGNNA